MTINEFSTSVAAAIKAKLPDLKACTTHPGRFNLDEVKRLATRVPAVYVASMGVVGVEEVDDESRDVTLQMVAYVLTKDVPNLPKEVSSSNIVSVLVAWLPSRRFGKTGGAQKVTAQNFYSGTIDKAGVAIWAVIWRQTIRMSEEDLVADGIIPTDVYVGVTPDVGPPHIDDYVEITADE